MIVTPSCKKPDDDILKAGAEGDSDEGFWSVDLDLPPADDGADELGTGEDPVLVPTGVCLSESGLNAFGYRHQCTGILDLSFEGTVVVAGTTYDFESGTSFDFGPGASNPTWWEQPDAYDNPLVAACCGPYDYDLNATGQAEKTPYVNNCIADSVQQACIGMPAFIEKLAAELPPDTDHKELIQGQMAKMAEHIDTHTDDCFWSLYEQAPGPSGAAWNELGGTTYAFCWTSNDCATVTLGASRIDDWTTVHDIPDPVPEWATCVNWDDNNTSVIPTASVAVPGYDAVASSSLAPGASLSVSSTFGTQGLTLDATASAMTTATNSATTAMIVSQLNLIGATPTAGPSADPKPIYDSKLALDGPLEPLIFGTKWVVTPGDAVFIAAVHFDGGSRVVEMVNATRLSFWQTSTGWEFAPFELEYEDGAGIIWTLTIDDLRFTP